MSMSHSFSACFAQAGPGLEDISPFPTSSSCTSLSTSSSTSTSTTTSTSVSDFGVDVGIDPSAMMLSGAGSTKAPVPYVQHPSIQFISARARLREFEKICEEIRKTEIIRDEQAERLHALASQASHELDVAQINGPMNPVPSIPVPQPVPYAIPGSIQGVGPPVNASFHPQVYPAPASMPTSAPISMLPCMPAPEPYHHYQPQRHTYVPVTGVMPSPGFIARGRVSQACESCKHRKVKCSGGIPCERCFQRASECVYGVRRGRGPTKKRREMRDSPVEQVPPSSHQPPPILGDAPASVPVHTSSITPISVHAPPYMSIPTRPHPNPPPPLPLSPPSSTSPRPKLLSRTLFSPPTPAEPTLVTASGHVAKPVASGHAQIYVARPPPPAEFIPRGRPTSIKSLRSSTEMAVSSAKPASPERYSDEEILMTLQMPPDPSGTPSGFIDFLDPCREVSPADDVRVVSNESPSFDFIMDFEEDLDTSFEMLVEQDLRLNLDKRVAAAGLLTSQAPSPPKRPPSMPTIFEEEEPEEEAGDVTITPSAAQRALLPPDRFARPRSASPLAQVVEASEDITDDSSDMDTPRPRVQADAFSAPPQNPFDDSFSIEPSVGDFQVSQDDSLSQFGFFPSMTADKSANIDFDGPFDVDFSAWNEAVFGDSPSKWSPPSSSSSLWELTSMEGSVMGMDTGINVQFPTVDANAIGNGIGMPTEEEFLKAIVEAAQSTPKARASAHQGFEFFSDERAFDM